MRPYPIRHELARHAEVERPAVGLEIAELSRLQPAVECARTKITAKAVPDRIPSGLQRCRHRRRIINRRIRTTRLHCFAPPSFDPPARVKALPLRVTRVARSKLLFSLAPGADSRPEEAL